MNSARPVLTAFCTLLIGASGQLFSQQMLHVVAEDDCGIDGKQRHLVSGLNWTYTDEEIPYSVLPKDSPVRSVSHGEVVHYRFRGLKSGARYQVQADFVADKRGRDELFMIGGKMAGDTIRLAPSSPVTKTYDVPPAACTDGQIDVEVKLVSGPNAVVSSLRLLSDDPVLKPVLDVKVKSDFNGMVTGQVVDENSGQPVIGAHVDALAGKLPAVKAVTRSGGEFSLRIPATWPKNDAEECQIEVVSGTTREKMHIALYEIYPEKNPLVVLPDSVNGVKQCRISLNGQWQFAMTPVNEFWNKENSSGGWAPIRVPGECRMQGFAIGHDREYAYRRTISIPADFKNSRIFVRFNGVYSFARVWVNGTFVRKHSGGFTSWDFEITNLVKPGEDAVLVLGVTDRVDEISFGSGYAKHPIGGILRGVELLALPKIHIRQLYVRTNLDSLYCDAQLRIDAALSRPADATIQFSLFDPAGKHVEIDPEPLMMTRAIAVQTMDVRAPKLWDAEHPRLYTLEARLVMNGQTQEIVRQRIGFREVKTVERQLLVNGRPVKLRGACRHDIHPTQGRSTTPEQDRQDVELAKEANFNFIRTSHYPPSPEFLKACDEIGIYIEEETAVCFVGTFRSGFYRESGGSQNDERYTGRYLSQLAEMIDRDRNHPAVIVWSIGNENTYGSNYQKEFDYVKTVDLTRPVMFSFPHTVPGGVKVYDIYSNHYPSFDRPLNLTDADRNKTVPEVGDEWMHVACYCLPDLRRDPNIRNFWGESIKRAWENNFDCDYSIGGAIWGMIDETFLLPDSIDGYGQWGILDVWRRKKPEFWHTRKAYSPVHLLTTTLEGGATGKTISLPIHNRFDHTNLNEIVVICSSGALKETLAGPDVPPHGRGTLQLPGKLNTGLPIRIQFAEASGRIIDEELLASATKTLSARNSGQRLKVEAAGDSIVARGPQFSVTFDRTSGLVRNAKYDGTTVMEGGPFIHLLATVGTISWDVDSLADVTAASWRCDSLSYWSTDTSLVLTLSGVAGSYKTRIAIDVQGSGEMTTTFEVEDMPKKYQEVGIGYVLNESLDRLSWNRRALWSVYPDDHIGRARGEAQKSVSTDEKYRQQPDQPWSQDTRDFYLFKTTNGVSTDEREASNDFRAMKENIERYSLWNVKSGAGLTVEADGEVAARTSVSPKGTVNLFVNTRWTYVNLSWGNFTRPVEGNGKHRGAVKVRLGKPSDDNKPGI
jgi:beta-galactosidase